MMFRYKLVERKAKCLLNIGRKKEAEENLHLALKSLEFSKCQENEKSKTRQNIENQMKQINSVNNVELNFRFCKQCWINLQIL